MRVLVEHDAHRGLVPVAHHRDVVGVPPWQEQPGEVDGLSLNFGLKGVNARSDEKTMTTVGTAVAMNFSVRTRARTSRKLSNASGDFTQVAGADVADDHEVRAVDAPPFGPRRHDAGEEDGRDRNTSRADVHRGYHTPPPRLPRIVTCLSR